MHSGAIVGGKYRLDRLIGEGAMGAVWAAVHRETHQPVAVKVVSGPEVLADELCSRLLREARACSLIRHPNVVSVVDVGQLDTGAPFMVMQLLQGETLDVRLKRDGKLAPVEAARIGAQVARALGAAHAAAIVHRDLKPANIFLHVDHGASQSVVKVLDFGVSKILSERAGAGPDARATATGHAMGSPAYMSPEQAKSANKVDSRADIWSLGVVLFEMFAGTLPFPGETAYAVIGEVLHGPIPKLREVVPALDPRLADLVARCIVRDVHARIATVEEVVRGLEGFLRDQQSIPSSLPNEKTEPLGSSRLRAAVLGSMRLGSVPDLEGPTPARPPVSEARAPSVPEPSRSSDRAVITPASTARPAPNGSAASIESFARAPTARGLPQLAHGPAPSAPAEKPAVPTLASAGSRDGNLASTGRASVPYAAPSSPSAGASALAALSPSNASLSSAGMPAAPPSQAGARNPPATIAMTGSGASLAAATPLAGSVPTAPPSNPQALGARSSTAPILLVPPGSQANFARPSPASTRRFIGIGAALGVTAVSLIVAIIVLLGGKPGAPAGAESGLAPATTAALSTSAEAPSATTDPTAPATASSPPSAPAPTTSESPSTSPSTTATTKPSAVPTGSVKRPGKIKPRPGTSFPTNPG